MSLIDHATAGTARGDEDETDYLVVGLGVDPAFSSAAP
jgi:hypothetical protein